MYNLLIGVIPRLGTAFTEKDEDFRLFQDIESLFDEGVVINGTDKHVASVLPRIVHEVVDAVDDLLKFDPPETLQSKLAYKHALYLLFLIKLFVISFLQRFSIHCRGHVLLAP